MAIKYSNAWVVNSAIWSWSWSLSPTFDINTLIIESDSTVNLPTIIGINIWWELKIVNRSWYTLTIDATWGNTVNGVSSITPVWTGVVYIKSTSVNTYDADFSDTNGATDFITLTESAFLNLVNTATLEEGQKYEVTNVGYIEPAYLIATSNNTYINLDDSWVAELDVTGTVTYDLTNISLAKHIRLITGWTTELLGNIVNNIQDYGNRLEIIQNTVNTAPSWLEPLGIGMNIGTPLKLFNRSYDWSISTSVLLYENSNPLTVWVDYNVVLFGEYTYIDPIISYPASTIEVEYNYIPNTQLAVTLTSVYDAITWPYPDSIVWDFGKQRLLYAYSPNTNENDYIEVVRWPQYNTIKNVRVLTDVPIDPLYRVWEVENAVVVNYLDFDRLLANGRLVTGRLYAITGPTTLTYTYVRATNQAEYLVENNQYWVPSWVCQLDSSTYLVANSLDISTAKYASKIIITSPNPAETIKNFTWNDIGKVQNIRPYWFTLTIDGTPKWGAVADNIVLEWAGNLVLVWDADPDKSDHFTFVKSITWNAQVDATILV